MARPREDRKDAGLALAIRAKKTITALAAALGLTPQAVSKWRRVPVERCPEVEGATDIPREVLRPDFYPPERPKRSRPTAHV